MVLSTVLKWMHFRCRNVRLIHAHIGYISVFGYMLLFSVIYSIYICTFRILWNKMRKRRRVERLKRKGMMSHFSSTMGAQCRDVTPASFRMHYSLPVLSSLSSSKAFPLTQNFIFAFLHCLWAWVYTQFLAITALCALFKYQVLLHKAVVIHLSNFL